MLQPVTCFSSGAVPGRGGVGGVGARGGRQMVLIGPTEVDLARSLTFDLF